MLRFGLYLHFLALSSIFSFRVGSKSAKGHRGTEINMEKATKLCTAASKRYGEESESNPCQSKSTNIRDEIKMDQEGLPCSVQLSQTPTLTLTALGLRMKCEGWRVESDVVYVWLVILWLPKSGNVQKVCDDYGWVGMLGV